MIPAAILELAPIWTLADITNGLMIVPNVLALLALRKVLRNETDLFCTEIKSTGQNQPESIESKPTKVLLERS